MAPNISEIQMTSDEEFQHLQPGDNTVTIVGAGIRFIEPRRRANAAPPKVRVLKVLLYNMMSTGIITLIWQQRIVEFEGKILRQIIEIKRPGVVLANPTFADPTLSTLPVELSVQNGTTIRILGPMPEQQVSPPIHVNEIPLSTIASAVGSKIVTTGWIHSSFERQTLGNYTYASGALTDFTYRICVNLTNFDQGNNLQEGSHVKIQGEVRRNRFNVPILQVVNMSDITLIDEVIMDRVRLNRGFRSVSKLNNENSSNSHSAVTETPQLPSTPQTTIISSSNSGALSSTSQQSTTEQTLTVTLTPNVTTCITTALPAVNTTSGDLISHTEKKRWVKKLKTGHSSSDQIINVDMIDEIDIARPVIREEIVGDGAVAETGLGDP